MTKNFHDSIALKYFKLFLNKPFGTGFIVLAQKKSK
jgi:hypothetical protein